MQELNGINYLAVLICGILATGLAALWYSPMLLGKMWLVAVDKSEEELKQEFNPVKAYSLSFIAQLVIAYVLATIMNYVGATTPQEGIRMAFLAWIGFTATTMTINMLFEGKTFKQFVVDGGYHLIVFIIYGIILGAWQ